MYFIIIIYMVTFFIQNSIEKNNCTISEFCDDCDLCGASTNNFTSCFYYHIFCKKDYYTITYSPFMKNSLINFFKNDSDLIEFCGKKEYKFENNIDEIIIFNSQNKTFPKDKYVHCLYSINNLDITQNKIDIYYDLLKNANSKEPRNLKFRISNIYKKQNTESVGTTAHDDLRKKNNMNINLNEVKSVDIFLDFFELNYNHPEEILKIRLVNVKNLKSSSSSSSSNNGTTIGSIIGGIAGLILIFIIIGCCCKGRKAEPTNISTQTNNTNTGIRYVPALVPVINK